MTLKNKVSAPIIMLSISLLCSTFVFAGDPPPVGGDPTTDPGATPIGGSAPVGSGLMIVIGMGLAYAGKKTFVLQQED